MDRRYELWVALVCTFAIAVVVTGMVFLSIQLRDDNYEDVQDGNNPSILGVTGVETGNLSTPGQTPPCTDCSTVSSQARSPCTTPTTLRGKTLPKDEGLSSTASPPTTLLEALPSVHPTHEDASSQGEKLPTEGTTTRIPPIASSADGAPEGTSFDPSGKIPDSSLTDSGTTESSGVTHNQNASEHAHRAADRQRANSPIHHFRIGPP